MIAITATSARPAIVSRGTMEREPGGGPPGISAADVS
jgi:hypothetical protein